MKQSFVIVFLCLITFMQESFAQTLPPVGFTFDAIRPTSCSSNDGSLTILPLRGTSPFTYSWSTGSTDISISNIPVGIYSATLTDATGETFVATYRMVARYMDVLGSDYQDNTQCPNNIANGKLGVVCANGIPPLSYQWSDGQTTAIATGLLDGSYSVTVTDANGCEGYFEQGVNFRNLNDWDNVLRYTDQNVGACATSGSMAVRFRGIAPVNYAWSDGQTGDVATGLAVNSTYTVTATDALGCVQTDNFTLYGQTIYANLLVTSPCNNSSNGAIMVDAVYNGIPPYTYNWSTGATTNSITGLGFGLYTVTVSDATGCQTIGGRFISPNDISFNNNTHPCDSVATVYVHYNNENVNDTYLWDDGTTSNIASNLSFNTVHSVTITTVGGCVLTDTISVASHYPPLHVHLTVDQSNANCLINQTGAAHITITGGIPNATTSIYWGGGTFAPLPQDVLSQSNLPAGNYYVYLNQQLNTENCGDWKSFVINDISNTSLTLNPLDADCGEANGSISSVVTGFSNPSYEWNDGRTTANITGLFCGGFYSLTVTQANTNCQLAAYERIGDTTCTKYIAGYVMNNTSCNPVGAIPQPFIPVKGALFNNGESLAFTDNTGYYRLPISFDSIEVFLPNLPSASTILCPSTGSYIIDGYWVFNGLSGNDFYLNSSNTQDFRTYMVSLRNPRPGYPNSLRIYVHNDGAVNTGSVHLNHDILLSGFHWFTNRPNAGISLSSYDPISGTAVWSFNNINAGEAAFIQIDYDQLATNTAFGNFTEHDAFVENINSDVTPGNNSTNLRTTIQASYDPNSVEVHPFRLGNEKEGYVYPADHDLTYTIHFQNMGNAEANTVVIIDEIDAALDLSTITNVVSSHPDNLRLKINNGKLECRFTNINLPAQIADEAGSMGFVQFQISRTNYADLTLNSTLTNKAAIYFDYNEPIMTNIATTHVVESGTVQIPNSNDLRLSLVPNPSNGNITLNYHISNNDNISIYVYNAAGALVRVVTEGEHRMQGANTYDVNLYDLSAGVYFVQLRTSTNNAVQKLIKL